MERERERLTSRNKKTQNQSIIFIVFLSQKNDTNQKLEFYLIDWWYFQQTIGIDCIVLYCLIDLFRSVLVIFQIAN